MSRSSTSSGPIAAKAKRVLKDMGRLNITPSPQNYFVWYEYLGGLNAELTRAVEDLIGSREGFTENVLNDLYREYVSDAKLSKNLKRAHLATQTVVKDVFAELISVGGMTAEYQRKLEYYAEQLNSAPSGVEFSEVIGDLLRDTTEMTHASVQLVRNLEETKSRTEALQRQLQKIEKEGLIDHLTGLGNRKAFGEKVLTIRELSMESEQTFCSVLMNLDRFDRFHQLHGQEIEEAVLRRVAKTLKDNLKGRDFTARLADEKFALVLPGTPLDAGVTVANILGGALSDMRLQKADSETELGSVTASFGVAQFDFDESGESLIERADKALSIAIRLGGNKVATERDL